MLARFHSLIFELSKHHQTLVKTKQLHALIIRNHLSFDPFYATKIIRFYAVNNDLVSARHLFDETPHRSVYLWNSMIRAYARAHKFYDSFWLFKQMLSSEIDSDNFTFACILRACAESFDLEALKLVHGGVVVWGLGLDSICSSALVAAYSKLGLIDDASRVFSGIPEPDLVLWNTMISGYGCCGCWEEMLPLFNMMRNAGIQPDGYTLVGLISGLFDPSLLGIGQGVHGLCLKSGVSSNAHVGSVLVSMYARFKSMDSACKVFDSLLCQPDLVTWSSLISGFSQCGDYAKALYFFQKMNIEGTKADTVLLACVLATSAQLVNLRPGIEIHSYAVRHECDSEVMLSSALIDMYAKCGFLESGIKVFQNMPHINIVSYNSVISSLGLYGLASEAFKIFREMLWEGLKPDESTFSALLGACCHAGLVKDGREFFKRMKDEFGIKARTDHYVHMVKLLGMAGDLEEAYDFIQSLPEPVDSAIWGALLACCDVHGNSNLAEVVSAHIFENKTEKSTYRVTLSNIYAGYGRWDDVEKLRDNMVGGKVKMPGASWLQEY